MSPNLIETNMSGNYKIDTNDLAEYLAVLARYADIPPDDSEKIRELTRSYAELKFRIMGGSRCAMCNSHVRHVVPVMAERPNGEVKHFPCLCTRCFEGEKAQAAKIFLEIGDNRVEVKLKPPGQPMAATPMAIRKSHA